MDLFSGYNWIFFSKLVPTLFWIFTKIFMRYFSHEAINSVCSSNPCHENYQSDSNNSETITEAEVCCCESSMDTNTTQQEFSLNDSNGCAPEKESKEDCSETVNDAENLGLEEEETTKLVFKFQYQTWNCSEEFKVSNNKYEFISSKSFSHFLEEQEASSFTVKQLYVHSKDFPLENDSEILYERNSKTENCEISCADAAKKLKSVPSIEQHGEDQVENLNNNIFVEEIVASEDDFDCLSFELDSNSTVGEEFLSHTDFGTTIELDTLGNHDEDLDFREEKNLKSFNDEERGTMEEKRKLDEDPRLQNSDMENMEKLKDHYFEDRHSTSINSKHEESVKLGSLSLASLDLDDSYKFDAQWEHQDLIEQLKMELKKVRDIGLPTILENSESLRIMEDLKPWTIDEKFQHGNTIKELPKFYKSYRERMRKFDILSYQKHYAIGSLQSKDKLQSFSSHENSSPTITSFLQHGFHLSRHKKSESNPMKKFIREFYSDLEMVYVGQLCLSWEFLMWEYKRALELWESDQCRLLRYNEVAEEFQQFQVLLQRFIENEPFQGPRVENYVRNRCVMLNLLQVPVIREDKTKEEKNFRTSDAEKDAITSDMLVEILEESIRIIWRFIKADKDASSLNHKNPRETQVVELQDHEDLKLLVQIQTELQKKEKRLSEILKSRSSILKKFQKNVEDNRRDNFYYFFSQVDMKLIWRVLNMSRTTKDQVAWCRDKLNKINFVNNKRIHIEPSFLLFPC